MKFGCILAFSALVFGSKYKPVDTLFSDVEPTFDKLSEQSVWYGWREKTLAFEKDFDKLHLNNLEVKDIESLQTYFESIRTLFDKKLVPAVENHINSILVPTLGKCK
ncbi:hypothetical protein ROZALSC1DRAFT_29687 [Rozella allomycis CSF55]|uniref:Uncharacterized protein n=1 Tax=Rozella allomycis (strain CSF55) TaxID=988480 RepID=A0A4P9YH51_ROZAC|nr:hypothetical protein ROZALSC1DRAFT_29687 [Rozella allomycis CSF55]